MRRPREAQPAQPVDRAGALRAALARARSSPGDPRVAEELLALAPWAQARGPLDRYESALRAILAKGSLAPTLAHDVRAARGASLRLLGDLEGARGALIESLAGAEELGDDARTARALVELGLYHHQLRALDEAWICYRRARDLYERAHDAGGEARVLGNLGAWHHDRGDADEARSLYRRALGLHRRRGEWRMEGVVACNLGVLEQEQGRYEAARQCFRRAIDALEAEGDARMAAIALGNLGMLEHLQGDPRGAAERHAAAVDLLRPCGDVRSLALAWARLAAAHGALGARDEGRRALGEARAVASPSGDESVRVLIALVHGVVECAPFDERDEAVEDAQLALGPSPAPSAVYDDVRWALAIREARISPRVSRAPEPSPGAVLSVAPERRAFRVERPGEPAPWVDLARYRALRRILGALVEAHGEGRPRAPDELVAVGWPGEKILPQAALNRLHVSLAGLRRRGLRAVLERTDDGYRLAPSLTVRRDVVER